MSLRIVSVVNTNIPEGELVWLQATAKTSLKGYALVDRTFANGILSNEFRHIFVFPDISVENGEWIALHTGTGTYRTVNNPTHGRIHHLYWNVASCVWNNNGGDTASLFKYNLVGQVAVAAVGS